MPAGLRAGVADVSAEPEVQAEPEVRAEPEVQAEHERPRRPPAASPRP